MFQEIIQKDLISSYSLSYQKFKNFRISFIEFYNESDFNTSCEVKLIRLFQNTRKIFFTLVITF